MTISYKRLKMNWSCRRRARGISAWLMSAKTLPNRCWICPEHSRPVCVRRARAMETATYYMTSFLCKYSLALLERVIESGFNFADCIITPDGCTMMNRAVENMELLNGSVWWFRKRKRNEQQENRLRELRQGIRRGQALQNKKMTVAHHMESSIRCWGVDADLFLLQCNYRSALGYSEIQIDAGERVQLIPDIYVEIIAWVCIQRAEFQIGIGKAAAALRDCIGDGNVVSVAWRAGQLKVLLRGYRNVWYEEKNHHRIDYNRIDFTGDCCCLHSGTDTGIDLSDRDEMNQWSAEMFW